MWTLSQRPTQQRAGVSPLPPIDTQGLCDQGATFQRFVDGAAAGDQRIAQRHPFSIDRPIDLTLLSLLRQHKGQRPIHGRKQLRQKRPISGNQKMVPDAGRNVGHVVGFAAIGLVGLTIAIVRPPAAVLQLTVYQPLIGPLGCVKFSRNGEAHRRLGVIPWVGVAAVEPGNLSRRLLGRKQKLDGGPKQRLGVSALAEI